MAIESTIDTLYCFGLRNANAYSFGLFLPKKITMNKTNLRGCSQMFSLEGGITLNDGLCEHVLCIKSVML